VVQRGAKCKKPNHEDWAASATTRTAIESALQDLFQREGAPGGTVDLSDVYSAIGSVPGSAGYIVSSITSTVGGTTTTYLANSNITNATGQLPVLGAINGS
jgi:uncharacterized phage protein gp47/JayE